MKIVVIGSGFGGLAAAIRLRVQGHEVTLLEKRAQPGGRAAVFRRNGFTFDAGPTIITAPQLIDELFTLAGRRREHYVSLVPLDPFYRVRFDDGSHVDWPARAEDACAEVRRLSPDDEDGYRRFAAFSERVLDTAFPLVDQPFDSLGEMARAVPDLLRTRAWSSVAGIVEGWIADPRLRALLSFHPLLIGGNPYDAPSIYTLIHALERRWGVWFAMGGTGALVRALARLFEDLGGEAHYEREVTGIEIDDRTRRATGVRLEGGDVVPAEVVVSNGEVTSTYLHLVPGRFRRHWTDRRLHRLRQGMSLFVLYFGTDRRYEDIAHHEIIMGARYRGLLDDVFHHRRLAPDFSLYLHRPTATDPSLAPHGCDSWYVLSPVPNLGGAVDWAAEGDAYRDRIVQFLEERLLPGLSRHIVTEIRVDPRYFRDELNSHQGGAFSIEPRLSQSAWFRPHCASEDVPNLYFVGAGTHPGAGVPGVLSSGKIAADLIADRYGEVRHSPVIAIPAIPSR